MDRKELLALSMDYSGYICCISDTETHKMLYMSRACKELCGLEDNEEYVGKKCYQLLHGLNEPCSFCASKHMKEREAYRREMYHRQSKRWLDVTDILLRIDDRLCRMEIMKDITDQKESASLAGQLTMEEVLFRSVQALSSEENFDTAVNLFLKLIGGYYHANRAYIFEFDMEKKVANNTFEWCLPDVSAEIDHLQGIPLEVLAEWIRKFEDCGEFFLNSIKEDLDQNAEDYKILEAQGIESLMAAPLYRDGQIVGFIGVDDPKRYAGNLILLTSVAKIILVELERRRMIADLERMSYTDSLTGIANRNYYNRILRDFNRKMPDLLGIVTLDINGLKDVNDAHGHEFGDHVLKRTAEILWKHFPKQVYRIGGDEFVVLCTDMSKEQFKERVVTLRHAFDRERDCNISMGFAWMFDTDIANVNILLQQADEMRHAEKQSYYHTVLTEGRSISRGGFAAEVLQEIENGRFMVYYQPQVNIQTGEVIGAEALVRKKAEDGSIVPPGRFIPFYEVGGVISHLDLFVLKSSCETLRQWKEQGYDLHISVNFSRITLMEPYIVDVISGICSACDVSPSSITIEVTESIGKMDNDQLKELIEKLKNAGFSISLDDFGSQYSNLAILAAMDFDEVKFDRSLVSTLEHSEKSRVVMKTGMNLCRELKGTSSLAEGIETKGQLDLLADYKCDYGQGYYFSKPIPVDEFSEFLNKHNQ